MADNKSEAIVVNCAEDRANPLELADPSLLRDQCLINGQWLGAIHGGTFEVTDPARRDVIGTVPDMGRTETVAAIAAAERAFKPWKRLAASERAKIMRRLFDLMIANREDLALIMTAEQGKPLAESRGEIDYAASFIEWFGEEAKRIYGDIIPENVAGRRILVRKEPIGVVAIITPWNFPTAMITRKAAPAWAAGCPVVIRPASQTPYSALAIGVLAERAGMPPGVCNIVTGAAAEIGAEMTGSTTVRKLSFTGSTPVGAKLLAQCAPTIKKASMELGGNAPFIVFDDADLDLAIEGTIAAKFRNAGQTCVCANRLLIQNGIYDQFVTALVKRVALLKVGDGREDGITQGPLIDERAVEKVQAHVDDAISKGARVLIGGRISDRGAQFFEPTVVADVTPDALCFAEETFGPFAPVFRFGSEEEAVDLANKTEFGLAAYLYTQDLSRALRVSEAIECGIVGINEGLVSTAVAPFGGVKASGLGREGSKYGIEDYLEIKYIGIGNVDQA